MELRFFCNKNVVNASDSAAAGRDWITTVWIFEKKMSYYIIKITHLVSVSFLSANVCQQHRKADLKVKTVFSGGPQHIWVFMNIQQMFGADKRLWNIQQLFPTVATREIQNIGIALRTHWVWHTKVRFDLDLYIYIYIIQQPQRLEPINKVPLMRRSVGLCWKALERPD